jgi:hypothetical protein
MAQVREQSGTLLYGDHVEVLAKRNDNVRVRTPNGITGWVDARYLMEPELWKRSEALQEKTKALPVQARGRTKVSTNLRVQPGRKEARVYQFNRGAEVEVLARAVADWVQVSDEKDSSGEPAGSKKEDWYLVRGVAVRPPGEGVVRNSAVMNTTQPGDQTFPIAGWVIARFISLDIPDQVREGTSAANVRPVAWFELNRVTDGSGQHPQYLVAGTKGPEGQPCDFTNLRVFTWNPKKSRYETAYIENDLCGGLPVRLTKGPKGEPEFRFRTMDGAKDERVYRLIQTVVRRIREDNKGQIHIERGGTVKKAKTKK